LTPGRQRAYLLHFSEPKQSATRVTRIERMEDKIMNGKGMTDCWCGLSKRMPTCDGSHRQLKQA
jgi:CDGSH-type Zn-finger protein